MTKKAITTAKAPAALGPYSQAIAAGNMLFISGQLPLDPESGAFVQGGIEEMTHQVIKNIKTIAQTAGGDLKDIVKTTIFLKDLDDFQAVNGVYGSYFDDTPPARSTIQVAALPLAAPLEIEAILVLG